MFSVGALEMERKMMNYYYNTNLVMDKTIVPRHLTAIFQMGHVVYYAASFRFNQ